MLKSDPYWWEDFAAFEDQPADLPTDCDVVVVGAGLTGCSAALTFAKDGKSVVLLDAQRPGYGASTRNGGMIGGGYRLSLDEMTEKYGSDTAHQLLRESHIDSLAFAAARIKEEGIDCDYQQYGRFRGQWNKAEYDETARGLDNLRKLLPVNIDMVPPEKQKTEIGSTLYSGGMLLHDHGGVHPGKYLNGMLKAAVRAGAQVFGETAATEVVAAGSGFAVTTPRGVIRAGAVLMATNGYTTAQFAELKRRMIPVSSFLIATEELPTGMADELMPGRRMCVETRNRHCYFRLSPDGKRLVLGGRAAMNKVPSARSAQVLRGLLHEIFPQTRSLSLTHSWTGQTGFSFSFMPQISTFDGVWHAMGYSGSGNAMAPYLGHKAALQMMGDPAGETAFSKTTLETRFWYRKEPWFLPFAHWLYRFKDLRDDRVRAK
ncbi:NAD(P)/FAD-dependent oxidoreductase [Sulfitobacter sp. JB4-11]|uniref:NAD(P)/FAD-dependent oxidoreductase n=1 Tax=Sulfitobacter rhodophyticola TaxID=3238304 RepID=UPI0035182596